MGPRQVNKNINKNIEKHVRERRCGDDLASARARVATPDFFDTSWHADADLHRI